MKKIRLLLTAYLLLGLSTTGCVDVYIEGNVRANGSGTLNVSYMIVKEVVLGEYAQFAKNKLLPLTEEDVQTFVDDLPGATLINVQIQDTENVQTTAGREVGMRRVNYQIAFNDINEIKTNHVRFAFYPSGDQDYFQFRIDKGVTDEDIKKADSSGSLNPVAEAVSQGRNLTLKMSMPSRIEAANGQITGRSTSEWTVPIPVIVAAPQKSVVAWAKLARSQREQSLLDRLANVLPAADWKDPEQLPQALIENERYRTMPDATPQP